MRRAQSSAWLLTILTTFLSQTHPTHASPITDLWAVLSNGTQILQARCANSCGYYGQVCCESDEVCYTDPSNQQASCSAATAQVTAAPSYGGSSGCDTCHQSYVYWTSTFTGSDLVEYCSTYSSAWYPSSTYIPPQTTAAPVNCDTSNGGCSCGPICCTGDQYCQYEGQCAPKAGSSYVQSQTWYASSTYASYTAPLRPTTVATVTPTATVTHTTTLGFQPAVTQGSNVTIASEGSSSGLSGGAIAGIVIGVILGLIILILLCMCLCFGAAIDGILAFFGLGKRRRNDRKTTETYYRHSGSRREDGRTWYGASKPPPRKKSGGISIWAGLLAAMAGFGAAVGLGRDKRRRDEKSQSSYSSYSYDSQSSDRRTRDSRRSRRH